ncbi:hypothetical protein K2X33_03935 [bacterium]|nr:hypothetical protein [bacterium]
MGFLRANFNVLALATLLCASAPACWDPISARYFRKNSGTEGYQISLATIFCEPDSKRAEVRIQTPDEQTGTVTLRSEWVPVDQIQQALDLLKQKRVSVWRINGGRSNAEAEEIALYNDGKTTEIGINYHFQDSVPIKDIQRDFYTLGSLAPLSDVGHVRRISPKDVPITRQRFLVGSKDPSTFAIPVIVLAGRILGGGERAYIAAERRALYDPKVKLTNLYLIPEAWIRIPKDEAEYQELALRELKPEHARQYRILRQQALFPWLHRFAVFPEAPPGTKTNMARFKHRTEFIISNLKAHRCQDFLLEQANDDPGE